MTKCENVPMDMPELIHYLGLNIIIDFGGKAGVVII